MAMKSLCCVLLLAFAAGRANAQDGTYKYSYGVEPEIVDLAAKPASRTLDKLEDALDISHGSNVSKLLFFTIGYKKFVQEAESARMDKQTGATSSSQGSTSIVSKGVAAQVLSLATEEGALTRTDSKTTSTFQVNALGGARLVTGADEFPYCAVYDYHCESPAARFLRGLSTGVSFYTAPSSNNSASSSSGSTNNANALDASTRNIAGWTIRYDFHVRRDTKDMISGYQKAFGTQYTSAGADGAAFLLAIQKITDPLVLPPSLKFDCTKKPIDPATAQFYCAYIFWQNTYANQLLTAQEGDYGRILIEAVTKLAELAKQADPSFETDSQNLMSKMTTYFGNRDALLSNYINKVTYSIEYDESRPNNEPTQSTAKFILSARPSTFQLTANASLEWYDQTLKSNVSRLRDAQVALQFDKKFGTAKSLVSPDLSAGYYFQYMVDKALLTLPSTALAPGTSIPLPGNASELLNTTGPIHLGQVKVTFSIRNTGINFPIALTFSNRTDLIKATDVRGNFGITYDLDSLFTKN
jgi:hypothetical protein